MKEKGKLLDKIVMGVDLPSESVPGMSLLEMVGNSRILIENHRGVTQYGCDEIHIKVSFGFLYVRGSELQLACMTKQQLVIVGKIESVSVVKGCGK